MDELRERLRAVVDEARAAGRLEDLSTWFEELCGTIHGTPASSGDDALEIPSTYDIVGDSPAMQRVFALIERVAPSPVSVLIQGETGSGKELVARALHQQSGRKGAFLAENCAAVPANLLESELFGHKRGSFTGAVADRDGHFVAADGGTLFLDEIGDMPLEMQAKLLRVLESREVRPVGANATVKVDVRVLAASHRDLEALVREKGFREDLLYRLNVVTIHVPPLRDRREDIAHLARAFLARANAEASPGGSSGASTGARRAEWSAEALAVLERYDWPGNVRQLQNEVQRAVALSGGRILPSAFSPEIAILAGEKASDA